MKRRGIQVAAFFVLVGAVAGRMALAQDANVYWSVSTGASSVPGNWSPSRVPGPSDFAWVANGGQVQIDQDLSAGALCVDQDSNVVLLAGGSLSTQSLGIRIGSDTFSQIIGYTGNGTFTQSGGTNSLSYEPDRFLVMGLNSGSNGTYILEDGVLNAGSWECIGWDGNGAFRQLGGTHTINGWGLDMAENPGSTGTYFLDGAASVLNVIGWELIGQGQFTQRAGTNTVSGFVGIGLAASGSYDLAGGTFSVSGEEYIGVHPVGWAVGHGQFTQTGGSHLVGGNLFLGLCGDGGYILDEGTLSVSKSEYIGRSGTYSIIGEPIAGDGNGIFIQAGGIHTIHGNLKLGQNGGSDGRYTLTGGALHVYGSETVSDRGGNGTFNQTGGTHTVNGKLDVAGSGSGCGSYYLSGAASVLNVDVENIGSDGSATSLFLQTGGTHTVSDYISIAPGSDESGTYDLRGGAIHVGNEFIGPMGRGRFTQTDGTHTIGGLLLLGFLTGGSGEYTFNGGVLKVDGDEFVGGGSVLLVDSDGNEWVGGAGTGTFTQTGGNHRVGGTLMIASSNGATGVYTLQSGDFIVPQITIGTGGTLNLGLGGLASSDPNHPAVDLYNDGRVNVGDSNGMPVTYCFGDITGDGNIVIGDGATLWVKSIGGNDVWINEGGILIFSWENTSLYSATAMANYELAVPEPATFTLVATVGACLLLRKRRL